MYKGGGEGEIKIKPFLSADECKPYYAGTANLTSRYDSRRFFLRERVVSRTSFSDVQTRTGNIIARFTRTYARSSRVKRFKRVIDRKTASIQKTKKTTRLYTYIYRRTVRGVKIHDIHARDVA